MGRTILFWIFVLVEVYLFSRFIVFPIFKLLKLQKGIDYTEASRIIGNHFGEVSDKLTNFLQLSTAKADQYNSELLFASIEQKANALQPIPFANAINFTANKKFLPLAILPILFFLFFFISGNSSIISQSLNRVVHFNTVFLPPAPFEFEIMNKDLQTQQNKDFILKVKTVGKIIPENVMIFIGEEKYFMESTGVGEFQFKIEKPSENVFFRIEANTVSSPDYELKVLVVPSISNLEMQLEFPLYLKRKSETIKGTGNAFVPEGTKVTWKLKTIATNQVQWSDFKQQFFFFKTQEQFLLSKKIYQNTEYQILTSNNNVKNYEKLDYEINVIKDQYPTISVGLAPDSLKINKNFVLGQVSDDYGLHRLQVVYYPKGKSELSQTGIITINSGLFDQFVFSFPSSLAVQQGVTYDYYFEVFDNDDVHHFKSTRSPIFSNHVLTELEKDAIVLEQQNENIHGLEKSLKNQDKQISELEKLQKSSKEKDYLEFKDQQKINEYINRQMKQDELMKEFSEKMKDNLEQFKTQKVDEFKQELQKRLENAQKDIDNNKKLLEELKELNDKLKNEELLDKLDQFKQNSQNQNRNLEQLVELTKKYYVEKKAEQVAMKLNQLSEKQDKLADNKKENNIENQNKINNEFNEIKKNFEELNKENKELKAPLDLPNDKETEKSIDEDLNKATEELQKEKTDKAKPKQKSAAKSMKQMSAKMEQSMESADKEQMEEDVKLLRQILDNLLAYSFNQEDLMLQFKGIKMSSPSFNKNLKVQQDLKLQFQHVDDSLFAMSLRNPKIAEDVTKEIGKVHYNIDKSLESLVEAQISKGRSYQQYAIASANKLADFLSDVLNNMQMSLSGSGMGGKPKPGKGEGMQLPDIIKKQEALGDKMKKGLKPGEKPGEGKTPGKGKDGKEGKGNQPGGEQGNDGEGDAKSIMEIYKEQQQLRDALQNELNKQGLGGSGQNAMLQMKEIEKQLLNKGFNNEVLQKMMNLKYELLKLDEAIQLQGKEKKRQAETNRLNYNNNSALLPVELQQYLNSIEILDRQSLPLRSNFEQKVQEYFKSND